MAYLDALTIIGALHDYSIGLINDTRYDPGSSDNIVAYTKLYADGPYSDYSHLTKHGIFVLKDGTIINAACVCSSGGPTGIHPCCSILEDQRLLVCCGNNIFCLTVAELDLLWMTNADPATCFEIYKFEDSYIVHGELEISGLNKDGKVIWRFSGPDIFTTPTGEEDFKLESGVIEAISWDGTRFRLDARTGKFIKNN